MAIPRPSAPRMVGTGFSRTKCSVRSKARLAFSLVWSHVWLISVETCSGARRSFSRPVEPMSSSGGGSCAGSGSSLVRSFSFGFIQDFIVCRHAIAFLRFAISDHLVPQHMRIKPEMFRFAQDDERPRHRGAPE